MKEKKYLIEVVYVEGDCENLVENVVVRELLPTGAVTIASVNPTTEWLTKVFVK